MGEVTNNIFFLEFPIEQQTKITHSDAELDLSKNVRVLLYFIVIPLLINVYLNIEE